jgi:hypothetical protein
VHVAREPGAHGEPGLRRTRKATPAAAKSAAISAGATYGGSPSSSVSAASGRTYCSGVVWSVGSVGSVGTSDVAPPGLGDPSDADAEGLADDALGVGGAEVVVDTDGWLAGGDPSGVGVADVPGVGVGLDEGLGLVVGVGLGVGSGRWAAGVKLGGAEPSLWSHENATYPPSGIVSAGAPRLE